MMRTHIKLYSSKTLSLIFTLIIISLSFSDIFSATITGQNEMRYGRRSKSHPSPSNDFNFLENYLELDASYENVRFHVRQRYLMPSEYGERLDGLEAFDKIYAEYSAEHITIRGGDFYRNWGRGLMLGAVELIDLNYDNGLEGVLIEGDYDNLEIAVFHGAEIDTPKTIVESAEGLYTSYRFPLDIKLGMSIVHFDEGLRHPTFERRGLEAEVPFDFGSYYVVYTADSRNGFFNEYNHSFYSSLEFYGSGWAVILDYKNYKFPDALEPFLQFPPPVYPQALMYLFSRNPPQPHYRSEVGYQLDAIYNIEDWNLNWNINQSSFQDGLTLFPKQQDLLQPFWSTFFHIEHAPLSADRILLQGGYSEQTGANYRYGAGILYEWRLPEQLSLTSELQSIWVNDMFIKSKYREDYLNISFARSNTATLTGLLGRSGDSFSFDGTKVRGDFNEKIFGKGYYWPAALLTVNFLQKHQARIFYGYERGGLGCTGGLCRWVAPFKGIKLTLISQF